MLRIPLYLPNTFYSSKKGMELRKFYRFSPDYGLYLNNKEQSFYRFGLEVSGERYIAVYIEHENNDLYLTFHKKTSEIDPNDRYTRYMKKNLQLENIGLRYFIKW